jgi:hypothetical protein
MTSTQNSELDNHKVCQAFTVRAMEWIALENTQECEEKRSDNRDELPV